jgi:hypothetical protein
MFYLRKLAIFVLFVITYKTQFGAKVWGNGACEKP